MDSCRYALVSKKVKPRVTCPPKMFFPLAILCFAGVPMALSEKVHETMSIDEIKEVFHKPHHDLVPDYEVVQFDVPTRNKRDVLAPEKLVVQAFGDNIRVWLTPSVGVLATKSTPVLRASSRGRDTPVRYTPIPDAMRNLGKLWEDSERRASFVVSRDTNGQYLLDGFVGENNLVVRSLPESIATRLVQKRSLNDSEASTNAKSAYHVVFKGDGLDSSGCRTFSLTEARSQSEQPSNVARQTLPGGVFFPEIMVVVDDDLFYSFYNRGNPYDNLLKYQLAFWNGVDLLYRRLTRPAIRFNIKQIIIATDQYATPYLRNNRDSQGRIDGHAAWYEAKRYYYQKQNVFPVGSYDAVMTMIGRQMINPKRNVELLGVASPDGMCHVSNPYEQVLSIALVRDDEHFKNVFTAAHEFAHLVGVRHDGDGNTCYGKSGHIMNPEAYVTELSHDFSPCSVTMLDGYFDASRGQCMSNQPSVNEPLTRLLPGQLVSRGDVCLQQGYKGDCYTGSWNQSSCGAIHCTSPYYPGECLKDTSILPPDGSPCGDRKICMNGRCLFQGY